MISSYVELRSKTSNALDLENNTKLRNKLVNVISNFRAVSLGEATKVIFNLLYGDNAIRENTLRQYGFTRNEDMADFYTYLTCDEHVILLGNEFRYQYKISQPNFLRVDDDPRYQNELDTLKKAMSNHPVLFFKAVEFCKFMHESDEVVSNATKALMSKSVDSQLYGLRQLGHNTQYQKLLQPYAKEIGQLLLAMHSAYKEEQKSLETSKESNQPVSKESLSACDECLDTTTIVDKLSKFISNRYAVVLNIPRSNEFWKCLKHLRDLKLDLNFLVDKNESLCAILSAYSDLEKTFANLADVESAFNLAKKNFELGDSERLYEFSRTFSAYKKAMAECSVAFDYLVKCWEAFNNEGSYT